MVGALALLREIIAKAVGAAAVRLRLKGSRAPDALRANSGRFISLPALALTVLISEHPDWKAWAYVVAEPAGPTTLLAASTALLALLLFAANQLNSLHRDADRTDAYLGENRRTFQASNSWAISLFGGTEFYLAVIALFFIPVLLPTLPVEVALPRLGALSDVSLAPQTLALGLWCACFLSVGTALIFNALETLRAAAWGIRAPHMVDTQIERGIERESRSSYAILHAPSSRRLHLETESWVDRHVRTAGSLPAQEQPLYLQLTVGARAIVSRRSELDRLFRVADRTMPKLDADAVGFIGHVRRLTNHVRHTMALAAVERCRDVIEGRSRSLLRHLDSPELVNEAKIWIVGKCLRDATAVDGLVGHRANTLEPEFGAYDGSSGTRTSESIFLLRADRVHSLRGRSRFHLARAEREIQLEGVPSLVFETIAELLATSDSDRRVHLPESVMNDIFRAAEGIVHHATRDRAMRQIADAAIKSLVVDRHPGNLASDTLLRRVSDLGRDELKAAGLLAEARPSFARTLEQSAYSALLACDVQDSEVVDRLLSLTQGWHHHAAALYHLHYACRYHRSIPAGRLAPFYRAIVRQSPRATISQPPTVDRCVDSLRSSSISHFVTRDGLSWLLTSLQEPFTLDLCAKFVERTQSNQIRDFGVREFLLWRLVTDRTSGLRDERHVASFSGAGIAYIRRSLPELLQVVSDWRALDNTASWNARHILSSLGEAN